MGGVVIGCYVVDFYFYGVSGWCVVGYLVVIVCMIGEYNVNVCLCDRLNLWYV